MSPRSASFRAAVGCTIAVGVPVLWLLASNPRGLQAVTDHWEITATMMAGSFIGGATPEGGGAVGFPVLTKVLEVPPETARLFTFAIQTVGMGSATVWIVTTRSPMDRRTLLIALPPSCLCAVLCTLFLADALSGNTVRLIFTMIVLAMALALIVQSVRQPRTDQHGAPVHRRSFWVLAIAGAIGGIFTGFAGVGTDTVLFIVLVLLYRVRETIATATTVALMSVTSAVAFSANVVRGRFTGDVVDYWLAAVPVVAAGGVLGAYCCTRIPPLLLRYALLVLIAVEVVSTFLILPMQASTIGFVTIATMALTTGLVVMSELCGGVRESWKRKPRNARPESYDG